MKSILLLFISLFYLQVSTLEDCYLLYNQGKFQDTIDGCTSLIEKDANCTECYLLRGLAAKHKSEFKLAEKDFLQVINNYKSATTSNDSNYYYSHRYLGDVYGETGRYDDALSYYRKYIKFIGNDYTAYFNICALHFIKEDFDSVSHYAFEAYKVDSLDFEIVFNCGQVMLNSKLYVEAAFYYNKLLNISVDYRAYLGLGIIALKYGENDIANYNFKKVFTLTNNDPNAFYFYSLLKLSEGDTVAFCENMDKAISIGYNGYMPEHYTICNKK